MRPLARIISSPVFQETIGTLGAWYLTTVWNTSRRIFEPEDIYARVDMPAIFALWHGQHFLLPFLRDPNKPSHKSMALISRHRDGEINARATRRLGIESIRGSGSHNGDFHRKGAVSAFNKVLEALEQGYNIGMTADVPKVARVASLGLIKLAQHSGRQIYPVGIASSRRKVLDNWDRTTINLPFSRIAVVAGTAFTVPRDADKVALESFRQMVENELNRVTARAYEIADRKGKASL